MRFPQPPKSLPEEKKSGELTEHEYTFILDATLKPAHRRDGSVIRFIESFIRCKSVRQASEEAGIHNSLGYMIRHRKDVANCIQKITDKSSIKYGFDASEIFERVKEIVEFDPIMLYNQDGTFKSNLHDIEPAGRRNLKSLKVKNLYNQVQDANGIKNKIIIGEVIEYEFYDKLKAAELAGKEKDMFKTTTRVEHDVTKNMRDILLDSSKRADQRAIDLKNSNVVDVPYKDVTDNGESEC